MPLSLPRRRSPLLRQLLGRTAAFTAVAVVVVAAVELLAERHSGRAEVDQRARHAAELASGSVANAVWTYDQANLLLAVQGLLRDGAISEVRIDTAEPSMRLDLKRPGHEGGSQSGFTLPLLEPRGLEPIGRMTVRETFREVDSRVLSRIAYRAPLALLELLTVVFGLTVLAHRLIIARINGIAHQLQVLEGPASRPRIVDPGGLAAGSDEIGQLAVAINQFLDQRDVARAAELARERAEASNAAKSQLLSRIGHELRTPLNAIVGFAQALRAHPVVAADPRCSSHAMLIERAGRHLAGLIEDLMDYSRLERNLERVDTEPVDIAQLCIEAMALVEQDARTFGVVLEVPDFPVHPWVKADPLRLEQVVLNLLSNAIKYNRRDGRVWLALNELQDSTIELTVSDTGMGMSAWQLGSLYQPFNRLGREAGDRPGTGIGLVISRQLVARMDGELRVQSEEGVGTTFSLRLKPAPRPQASPEPGAPAPKPSTQPRRILYVEDDPVNVEVVSAALAARPHWSLRVVSTVQEARLALRLDVPALVLLDNHLPDGSGLEVLAALRAEPATSHLPVVMLSADSQESTRQAARDAGVDDYLCKPLHFPTLIACLDTLLAAAPSRLDTAQGC